MAKTKRWVVVVACWGAVLVSGGCQDPKDPQTWIKKLDDPAHTREAVSKLRELGDPVAVKPLCDLYKTLPATEILKTIISFKDRAAIPTLISALNFQEDKYHDATLASAALAQLKATEAVPALIKVIERKLPLKSRANLAKQEAIDALAELGDRKAVPALIQVVDARPEVQDFHLNKVAARALGELGDPRAVPVLIRALFMSSTVQGSAFPQAEMALAEIGPPAYQPLIDAMLGKDAELKALARDIEVDDGVILNKIAIVLGDLRIEAGVGPLLDALKEIDVADDLRAMGVIEGLGKLGDKRAVAPLLQILEDPKAKDALRLQAARALAAIGDPAAVEPLLQIVRRPPADGEPWDLRVVAAEAYSRLVGTGAARGVAVLEKVLRERMLTDPGYKQVRTFFEQALERAQVAVACKVNLDCYVAKLNESGTSFIQRGKAASMIGILPGGERAIPALTRALPLRDPVFRQILLETIKRVGRPTDAELIGALEEVTQKDSRQSPKFLGADLARFDAITTAVIRHKKAR